ncbi:MAG TPA: TerB family tellurite resistance protein [Thermoanaerobaculia bacterium]|nr:TerB family tellurite resistance protein [Thermoanaerobaculia bacterium]
MGVQGIRHFFLSRLSTPAEPHRPDPVAIAACALLLEIAHADDVFAPEERERILRAVREDLGVPAEDVEEVVRLAEEERRESVDLYQFTKLVGENFTRAQRLRLLEVIWGVVYADGQLTAVENQLARRIAELLGFQHPEVQAVREKVKQGA